MDPPPTERRKHYRLKYPVSERPTVQLNDQDFQVFDVSENGVTVLLPSGHSVHVNQPVSGVPRFGDGEHICIEGVVMRCDEETMALELSKGVSMKRMLAEQSRLRHKYPMLFDRGG